MNFNTARENMLLNQIRTWDFISPENIDLMRQLQREEFVPVEYRKLAFSDIEIPLNHNQFMMKPILEGRILQSLELSGTESVLEIGTGSAYLTALLALASKHVTTIDKFQDFTDSAIEKLAEFNISNSKCICSEMKEYKSDEKFDCIVVTGSLTKVPEYLFENLKDGGQIFAIIGQNPIMSASIITKDDNGKTKVETLFETVVKPIINSDSINNSNFTL